MSCTAHRQDVAEDKTGARVEDVNRRLLVKKVLFHTARPMIS